MWDRCFYPKHSCEWCNRFSTSLENMIAGDPWFCSGLPLENSWIRPFFLMPEFDCPIYILPSLDEPTASAPANPHCNGPKLQSFIGHGPHSSMQFLWNCFRMELKPLNKWQVTMPSSWWLPRTFGVHSSWLWWNKIRQCGRPKIPKLQWHLGTL